LIDLEENDHWLLEMDMDHLLSHLANKQYKWLEEVQMAQEECQEEDSSLTNCEF
jgi:hypothetical protein